MELTLELVNVKGFGGAGALREPIDSNSSFPVILTLRIVFATLEIFGHMLDYSIRFLVVNHMLPKCLFFVLGTPFVRRNVWP